MGRLYGLDALRGAAALLVAVGHLLAIYGLPSLGFSGAFCVSLFFMLSGFVMTRTYEQRMRDGLASGSFMLLRYRRLFLPMAVGSSVGLLWAIGLMGVQPGLFVSYIAILLFLPVPWMAECFLLNGPAWSLFAEVGCNALHPSLLAKSSNRRLYVAIAVLSLAWIYGSATGVVMWGPGIGHILSLLPGALACYLVGIVVYRKYGDFPLGNAAPVAVAGVVTASFVAGISPAIDPVVTLLVAPIIIRASLALNPSKWAWWAGALSFPLYAVHQPVMRLAMAAQLNIVLAVALSFGLAALLVLKSDPKRVAPNLPVTL